MNFRTPTRQTHVRYYAGSVRAERTLTFPRTRRDHLRLQKVSLLRLFRDGCVWDRPYVGRYVHNHTRRVWDTGRIRNEGHSLPPQECGKTNDDDGKNRKNLVSILRGSYRLSLKFLRNDVANLLAFLRVEAWDRALSAKRAIVIDLHVCLRAGIPSQKSVFVNMPRIKTKTPSTVTGFLFDCRRVIESLPVESN